MDNNIKLDDLHLPYMLTAKHIQSLGFSRPLTYKILNRPDVPVVRIGKKVFVQRDSFLNWINSQQAV